MKNIVFWFSGTGNSLKAAKDIANILHDCELVSMTGPAPCLGGDYDRIGFVFPLYCFGIPAVVRRFLEEIDLSKQRGIYMYAIVTRSARAGNDLAQVNAILNKKGLRLHYGVKLLAAPNCIVLHPLPKNQDRFIKRQDDEMATIIHEVIHKERNSIESGNFLLELIYKLGMKDIPRYDRKFNVSEACVSCGLCAEICPVGNIVMEEGRPAFQHRCELCLGCIHWCPEKAINCGKVTRKRGRYHHPEIKAEELKNRPRR